MSRKIKATNKYIIQLCISTRFTSNSTSNSNSMSTSDYTLTSRVELNDGNSYPRLGLGVYESEPGEETFNAVLWALQAGYRHIDGAEWYENEADCGRAIKHFISTTSVLRSEIYFTTKLMHNKSREWVTEAVKISLEKSGLDYIDLYLVHDPNGGEEIRNEVWKGCCDVKDLGLVKSIGVSNFGVVHLEQLLASKPKYIPAVNQVVSFYLIPFPPIFSIPF